MNTINNGSFQQNAVQQRLILEAAKDYAIFSTDLHRRVTTWNAGAETLFGYTQADIIGQLADVLFVPEDRPHAPEYEFGNARTEGRADNERWHLRQDGSRIYGSGVVTPLHDEMGQVIGLVKVMRDLTRQKQAEEALSQSEERFRAFVTATSDVVYRMSADWQQMYQLVGKSFLPDTSTANVSWLEEYIPQSDQAQARVAIREAIEARKTFELTHRVVQADGSLGWTFFRAIPILNEQSEIMEWFGTASDVTQYKRAEKVRQQSEAQYRTLFNSIDEGFCTVDIILDEKGKAVDYRFLEANPAFIRQTGLENAIGRTILELAPDHEPFWINTYGHIAKTGEAMRFEHQAAALGRYYDVYAFRIGEPTEHTVAILFNDITERKRHEANLAFLSEASRDLVGLTNIEEMMNVLGARIGGQFKASVCVFSVIDEAAGTFTNAHVWHRAGVPSIFGTFNIDDYHSKEVRQAMRAGETYFVDDTANDPRTNGKNMAALGTGSFVSVPLVRDGEWRFNLTIVDTVPRNWHNDEIELVRELITRIWTRLERAHAEESLAASEEKFRTLFEKMGEGFALCEGIRNETGKLVDYRHLLLNPAYERLTGLKREDALGKRTLEIAPGMEDCWFETFQQVLDTGETIHFEQYHPHFARWYEITAFRYTNETFAAIYTDITERKQSQQHQAFLLKFSDALRTQPNADAIANCALQILAEHLQLDRCYIGVYRLAEDRGEFTHQVGNDRVPPVPDGVRLSDFPDALRVAFDRTLVIDDVGKTAGLTDMDRQNLGALGFSALVASTLRHGESNPLWSIVSISAQPRHWTSAEIKLIEEVTERTWTAIERVKAEEALAASEEKYRALFDSMHQGFGIAEIIVNETGLPADYRMLELNRQFEQLTGQKRETFLDGRTVRQIAPELEEHWYDFYGNVALTGTPAHRDIHADGWNRWFEVTAYRTGQPEERRVAILFNDITERKQAEERQAYLLRLTDVLRPLTNPVEIQFAAESILGQHLRADRVGYAVDGGDGKTVTIIRNYTNGVPGIEGVYQYADYGLQLVSELRTGRMVVRDNIALQADLTEAEKQAHEVLQLGATVNVPLVKQGELLAILFVHFSMPHTFSQHELALIQETAERTWATVERAKSEAALRESQRFVQGIITSLPLVIYLFDLVERKNVYLSPQVAELFGYTPDEVQATGPSIQAILIHPDDQPRVVGHHEQIVRSTGDQVFSVELRTHHKQRGWIWVVFRDIVYARDGEGRPIQLLGTAEDISERRGAEDALRLADQRKDEFLALLAHELRNPLATLNNTLLILQLTGGTHESFELPTAVTLMIREIAHLVRLVDDLLDVSRISRGKIVLTKSRVDLVSVIRESVEAVDGGFQAANRTLTVALPTESLYLSGDATRLKQVVSNLLNNALKFTQTGGHVWVSLETTQQEPGGATALLRVRDDGIGIADHDRERIFQMFVQVDSSLGRTQDGLGLGLTLVNELVGLHGGRVEVHSAGVGGPTGRQGSEFVVYFPIEVENSGAAPR